jgi:hypothetical protein
MDSSRECHSYTLYSIAFTSTQSSMRHRPLSPNWSCCSSTYNSGISPNGSSGQSMQRSSSTSDPTWASSSALSSHATRLQWDGISLSLMVHALIDHHYSKPQLHWVWLLMYWSSSFRSRWFSSCICRERGKLLSSSLLQLDLRMSTPRLRTILSLLSPPANMSLVLWSPRSSVWSF